MKKQLTLKDYTKSSSYKKTIKDFAKFDKWAKEGKCIHCGSEKKHNEKYDAMYCPKCKYWTEPICPVRTCEFCSKRPRYPT